MTPTQEQSEILDALTTPSNLMIRALAGTGKTSTLQMIDAALPGPTLFCCFNKAIAVEAERRVRSTTQVRTFNSLGHKIWASACAHNLKLDPQKILNIFKWLVDMEDRSSRPGLWAEWDTVRQGVDLARALGYIPDDHAKSERRLCLRKDVAALMDEQPSDLARTLIDRVLIESIRQAYNGVIDFADQTYMSAMFGGTYPRFPLVLIDEYQDLSPVNHEMVRKLTRSSRQIGVGDEAQAIYGFRGASASSMRDAVIQFDMRTFPLTLSWRCPSAIVKNVHWHVPDFKAAREGGVVIHNWKHGIADESTVLCRNNAPLVALAMQLVISGRSVNLSGIDIATRILKLMSKLGPETMTSAQTLSAIDNWEVDRLGNESKSASDLAECMRVFARQGTTLDVAIAYAKHLFNQSGTVRFLSGHKSKGLEWDHVYHLDSNLLGRRGQDPNVKYVIDTRAKESLTYIESSHAA